MLGQLVFSSLAAILLIYFGKDQKKQFTEA